MKRRLTMLCYAMLAAIMLVSIVTVPLDSGETVASAVAAATAVWFAVDAADWLPPRWSV